MSKASEIEQLASLLDRGLLTKDEFDAQKKEILNPTRVSGNSKNKPNVQKDNKFTVYLMFLFVVLVAIPGACSFLKQVTNPSIASQKCDSPLVVETLKQAVNSIPLRNLLNMSIISIPEFTELFRNDKEVGCIARVVLGNTERAKVRYKFYSDGSQLLVEAKFE